MRTGREQLTGIVLAGGHSVRLGRSKPLMHLGGKLVLARVADTIRPLCAELILVVRPDQDDDTPDAGVALGMHIATDTLPYKGPLAAIHAGLAVTVTPLAFVIGGDHPFVSRPLVSAMVDVAASPGGDPESAVIPRLSGVLNPLHAVYPVSEWTPLFARSLAEGMRSPVRVIERAQTAGYPPVSIFTEDEIEQRDPQMLSLFDIDTPERLGIARRVIESQRPNLRPNPRRDRL